MVFSRHNPSGLCTTNSDSMPALDGWRINCAMDNANSRIPSSAEAAIPDEATRPHAPVSDGRGNELANIHTSSDRNAPGSMARSAIAARCSSSGADSGTLDSGRLAKSEAATSSTAPSSCARPIATTAGKEHASENREDDDVGGVDPPRERRFGEGSERDQGKGGKRRRDLQRRKNDESPDPPRHQTGGPFTRRLGGAGTGKFAIGR